MEEVPLTEEQPLAAVVADATEALVDSGAGEIMAEESFQWIHVLGYNSFEIVAAIITLASVYLVTRQNILCWPLGIISVVMYTKIFYDYKLYSDSLLQVYYLGMQVYGWYYWSRGGQAVAKKDQVPVTWLSPPVLVSWLGVIGLCTLALGGFMTMKTDADFPFADAFTTVASVVAQFWMTRKYVECWIAWIVVDVVACYIYYQKEMVPTAILYTIFLVIASYGFFQWLNAWKAEQTTAPPATAS